jgi:hypothetical protein
MALRELKRTLSWPLDLFHIAQEIFGKKKQGNGDLQMAVFKGPHPSRLWLKDFDNGCKWVCFWVFNKSAFSL